MPETHLEELKQAVFSAGAGRMGSYEQCCWQTKGQGQFRPLSGSQPHIGHQDSLSYVTEFRVELLVPESSINAVVSALREAHPYEEPAYDVIRLESY